LSFGPVTPFVTVLKDDPKNPNSKVETQWEYEDLEKRREARQASNWNTLKRMPLYVPWNVWQGEGWWKEMYDGNIGHSDIAENSGSKSKGKGKAKVQARSMLGNAHWKLREEVDLGLGSLGRSAPSELKILTLEYVTNRIPRPLLTNREARPYMPDAPGLTCHFGRHGSQERVSFTSLSTKAQGGSLTVVRVTMLMAGLQPSEKYEQVFYAGGPIWGMDWCPGPSSSTVHHLAVSTLRNLEDQPAIGVRRGRDSQAAIQIWSLDTDRSKGDGKSRMQCEMVICIRGGAALDLKWMPLGARDEVSRL
jgi:transcription factor C subunit 6